LSVPLSDDESTSQTAKKVKLGLTDASYDGEDEADETDEGTDEDTDEDHIYEKNNNDWPSSPNVSEDCLDFFSDVSDNGGEEEAVANCESDDDEDNEDWLTPNEAGDIAVAYAVKRLLDLGPEGVKVRWARSWVPIRDVEWGEAEGEAFVSLPDGEYKIERKGFNVSNVVDLYEDNTWIRYQRVRWVNTWIPEGFLNPGMKEQLEALKLSKEEHVDVPNASKG